jgi:hypothetical protein
VKVIKTMMEFVPLYEVYESDKLSGTYKDRIMAHGIARENAKHSSRRWTVKEIRVKLIDYSAERAEETGRVE